MNFTSLAWYLSQKKENSLLLVLEHEQDCLFAQRNLRFFLGPSQKISYLPYYSFDFYKNVLSNPETFFERNSGLYHALNSKEGIFITTLKALFQKLPDKKYFEESFLKLAEKTEIDRENLIQNLLRLGYQQQPAAFDPGVFAIRGGVVDIYCPLYQNPIRMEFFGDTLEEIRYFNPQSQLSLEKVSEVTVIAVNICPYNKPEELDSTAERIKDRLDILGIAKTNREELILKFKNYQYFTESHYLFPYFSKTTNSLFDYLPENTSIYFEGKEKTAEIVKTQVLPYYETQFKLYEQNSTPIAEKDSLFLTQNEFNETFENKSFYFEEFKKDSPRSIFLEHENITTHLPQVAAKIKTWMQDGYSIHLVCPSMHVEKTSLLFEHHQIHSTLHNEFDAAFVQNITHFSKLNIWVGSLSENVILHKERLIFLSEEELFSRKRRNVTTRHWSKSSSTSKLLSTFKDLKINDFLVHKEFGIGKYLGLVSKDFLGIPNDYFLIEYRDGDKLYIPIYRLNILQKYVSAEGGKPLLDKLGTDRWVKVKKKTESAIAEIASTLLKIQAQRKLIPGHNFKIHTSDYEEFEMAFPFEETEDQMKSIENVLLDLSIPNPMDRLLCGDVGYGKTEVAMRAAYVVASQGKQVAVLVPTKVLAFQHTNTFQARFKDSGLNLGSVSSLRTAQENKQTLADLKDGKIDIIIGTHRLLSGDIQFKDLGLVVIDEEHRFGVAHKERLKKLTANVHVLSMTATPIPRTLNMAMTGIKDISIITTPPPDRLAVRTFVCKRSQEVLVEAIQNELARQGQIFFVHNRIESIFKIAEEIKQLFPKITIEVVHGQMSSDILEEKMLSFYQGNFQVLLTTTIIESGLDIPRANTMIIDDADHFGLAQLYQLRGRVGRSDKRAYCYLLIPGENAITEDARERLQVIQQYSELGSGFNIASHDLEIRGAGEILGKEQSGQISAIGMDLYFELLEENIQQLKGNAKKVEIEPEINLKVPAYFPESYLPDISERISLYRRLSSSDSLEEIGQIGEEIQDRFGNMPVEVSNLVSLMRLKHYLKKLHVIRMSTGPKRTSLQFAETTPVKPELLIYFIQKHKNYSLTPDQKLVFDTQEGDISQLIQHLMRIALDLGVE